MNLLLLIPLLIAPTILTHHLLKRLRFIFDPFGQLTISLFLGQYFVIAAIYLSALIFGFSNYQIVTLLGLITFIDVWLILRQKIVSLPKLTNFDTPLFISAIIFSFILLLFLQRQMLLAVNGQLYTGHTTYGDLPMHLGMITSMAIGDNFPPQNPIYPGIKLAYPFFINLYSAILFKFGFSLQNSLIIPSLIFGFSLFSIFLALAKQFIKTNAGAVLALTIFLLNGGLGGYFVLKDALINPDLLDGLNRALQADIGVGKYNIIFTNNLSSVMLAQRSLMPGLAAFFLVCLLLWKSLQQHSKKELILAGLVTGMLPWWHTHSLLTLAIILPGLLICLSYQQRSIAKIFVNFLPYFITAVPLSIFGYFWISPQVLSSQHFISLVPGWIVGQEGPLTFWWRNLSIFMLILPIAFVQLDRWQKLFYIPFIVLFGLINLIQFQPLIYDNYKLAMIWYAVSSIIVARFLILIFSGSYFRKLLSLLGIGFLTVSGLILAIADYGVVYPIYTQEDIYLSQWVIDNTTPSSVFITAPIHNQFVTLSGRRILSGFPGYIWTHGLNDSIRQRDITQIYSGQKELIAKYNVSYLVLGPAEKKTYHPNEQLLDSQFQIVKQSQNYKIYRIP